MNNVLIEFCILLLHVLDQICIMMLDKHSFISSCCLLEFKSVGKVVNVQNISDVVPVSDIERFQSKLSEECLKLTKELLAIELKEIIIANSFLFRMVMFSIFDEMLKKIMIIRSFDDNCLIDKEDISCDIVVERFD